MKDEKVFVLQMLERAERILSYTKTGREEFLEDPKTQDAVVRNFEIIGEAAKRVSPALRGRAGDIPWARIAGFRDASFIAIRAWIWSRFGNGSRKICRR